MHGGGEAASILQDGSGLVPRRPSHAANDGFHRIDLAGGVAAGLF
jgi:hypothetical protein